MKTTGVDILQQMLMSPPSRRRGLKICIYIDFKHAILVASFAEAWIEKIEQVKWICIFMVASFAEAWIENPK